MRFSSRSQHKTKFSLSYKLYRDLACKGNYARFDDLKRKKQMTGSCEKSFRECGVDSHLILAVKLLHSCSDLRFCVSGVKVKTFRREYWPHASMGGGSRWSGSLTILQRRSEMLKAFMFSFSLYSYVSSSSNFC